MIHLTEATDLKAALDLANDDLLKLDREHRQLLRKERERNPEPDEELRGLICIDDRTHEHERPYAEREEFDQRMQAAVESIERRNYVLRVRFFRFSAIPTSAKGSIGFDREWTANLILGSVGQSMGNVIRASYEVEID